MKPDAAQIGPLAHRALVAEAEAGPKPGLVDCITSGAHRDMDITTFRKSAEALTPYLTAFTRRGFDACAEAPGALLSDIRPLGLEAESAMRRATGGVNTHKGAIFLFGILCFACGRLLGRGEALAPSAVCGEAAQIARPALTELPGSEDDTHGLRAYRLTGATGARGEAAYGFPHVQGLSLPLYRSLRKKGISENDALCHALMRLVADVADTNAIHRAGAEGASYARAAAADFLARYDACVGSPAWRAALTGMDADFSAWGISHGGCADLVAVTWFLDAICGHKGAE